MSTLVKIYIGYYSDVRVCYLITEAFSVQSLQARWLRSSIFDTSGP